MMENVVYLVVLIKMIVKSAAFLFAFMNDKEKRKDVEVVALLSDWILFSILSLIWIPFCLICLVDKVAFTIAFTLNNLVKQ